VAVSEKLNVPPTLGVPATRSVVALTVVSVVPVGSAPEATAPVQPPPGHVTERSTLYGTLTCPFAIDSVVIAGGSTITAPVLMPEAAMSVRAVIVGIFAPMSVPSVPALWYVEVVFSA
jgi:hypothetical protein